MTTTMDIDRARVEAFGERLLGVLNGGGLSLMISIGHRTGLFDAMAGLPASTSGEIAAEAGLSERYVREWLGAMTTGGIVEHDHAGGTYRLPAEHAALLTRAATPENFATTFQWISVLGKVEDGIVDRFANGGGLAYEDYDRFHEVMAEESGQTTVAALIERILPLAPEAVDALRAGGSALDVGCGAGRALIEMARAFPDARLVGYDLCADAVETARTEAERAGVKNVRFEARDVTDLGKDAGTFDLVTAFDAIHDQKDPAAVLRGIRAALKAGGTFLMQDIAGTSCHHGDLENPMAPFIYTISCMHCMSVSLGQGGAGLGAAWGEKTARRMLREAGFGEPGVTRLEHDVQNTYYVVPRG